MDDGLEKQGSQLDSPLFLDANDLPSGAFKSSCESKVSKDRSLQVTEKDS